MDWGSTSNPSGWTAEPPPPPIASVVPVLLVTLICWARLYFQEPFAQEPWAGRKSVIQSQSIAPQQKSEAIPPPYTRKLALPPGRKPVLTQPVNPTGHPGRYTTRLASEGTTGQTGVGNE